MWREVRYFLMIFLEIKYDHQGLTVVTGCEFYTLWGTGYACYQRGKYVPLDCMYSEWLPYKKIPLHVATSFLLSAP